MLEGGEGEGGGGEGGFEDAELGGYHEFLVRGRDVKRFVDFVAEVCDRGVFGEGEGMAFAVVGEGEGDGFVGCGFGLGKGGGIFCHTAVLQKYSPSDLLVERGKRDVVTREGFGGNLHLSSVCRGTMMLLLDASGRHRAEADMIHGSCGTLVFRL